jgi:hypothetical protein
MPFMIPPSLRRHKTASAYQVDAKMFAWRLAIPTQWSLTQSFPTFRSALQITRISLYHGGRPLGVFLEG